MKLEAIHDKNDTNSTGWKLAVNGIFECFLLGLPVEFEGQCNVPDRCCIPYGDYEIELYDSPQWGRKVPLLKNVPGRSFVEIHIANTPNEIRGCFAVGLHRGPNYVAESARAFNALMDKLEKAEADGETITITTLKAQEAF